MKIQMKNYKINSMRLKNWDYSSSGWYFITICTQNKIHYFSDISKLNLQKNTLGEIADKFWKEIPIHFPFIELGEYIIMPNHLHGLLYVNNQELNPIILHDKKNISPQKGDISTVIRSYKGIVTQTIRNTNKKFKWQSGYYDNVIKNEQALIATAQYIRENPKRWLLNHQLSFSHNQS